MAKLIDYDGSLESLSRIMEAAVDPEMEGFDFPEYMRSRHQQSLVPGHLAALAAARLRPPWESEGGGSRVETYPESLKGNEFPLMLIEPVDDPTCQRGWTKNIEAVVPDVRVEEVAGLHSPNIDRPALIAELLGDWLSSPERI